MIEIENLKRQIDPDKYAIQDNASYTLPDSDASANSQTSNSSG